MRQGHLSKHESQSVSLQLPLVDVNANAGALVHLHRGVAVTDSLTIAREFGRQHKDVLRTLDGLIADATIDRRNFALTSYTDEMNRQQRAIELDERAALIAMPFVGGRNSRVGQARLVDAFLALRERTNRPDANDWLESRRQTRASYRMMASALELTRADAGKLTKPHHYANEARLLNCVITGHYGPLDRDALSLSDLALLEELEARNAILIARGRAYNERKGVLLQIAAGFLSALRIGGIQ